MAEKESTTEALQRMMREQSAKTEQTRSEDGTVVINHPGNRGLVIGDLRGDMNIGD